MTAVVPPQADFSPRTLSLFSGGGGLDIGFALAGFNIIAAVELEPERCATLRSNEGTYFPANAQVFNVDICDFNTDKVSGPIEFIIGGPPCQTFSAIGRRAGGAQGTEDERGSLFEEYCRIVEHYQPRGFLFENVRGIISSNKGRDWQEIKAAFRSIGYDLTYKILNAADFGVAQRRERLILVGTRDGFTFQFPRPTHGPDSMEQTPYVGALEAMADLQDPSEQEQEFSGKYGHLLAEVPPGQNYHHFTLEMGYPNPVFAWRSRFSDFLYKADPAEPVRTVVAQLGKYSGPFHWKNRRFTLAETRRLQSFPDDYVLVGTAAQQLQQIGNSVPPVFAEHLAQAVLQSVFGVERGIATVSQEFKFTFDAAKGAKARRTRARRTEAPLFENAVQADNSGDYTLDTHFQYTSPLKMTQGSSGIPVHFRRTKDTCDIRVGGAGTPTIRYEIEFDRPIGQSGFARIVCESTLPGEQLYVAWDAIEECLKRNTSFQTMFDIYGHFTEPHPIFKLKTTVLDEEDPLLRLSQYFSTQAHCREVLHYQTLNRIAGLLIPDRERFIAVVKRLRELRLDVRVNQTNPRIPVDHFMVNYPFTLSLSRQVSVTWTENEFAEANHDVNLAMTYQELLEQTAAAARQHIENGTVPTGHSLNLSILEQWPGAPEPSRGMSVQQAIDTLIDNLNSNKYLFSVLVTALATKKLKPGIDVRNHQADMPNPEPHSNRSTDQGYVTPVLKTLGLTHCAASGMESGRNFERPLPLNLEFPSKPRGKGNREAFLGLVHAVQVEGADPLELLTYLFYRDFSSKKIAHYEYAPPQGMTVAEIMKMFTQHFREARGQGKSRLPVLALQAVYLAMSGELSRYQGKHVLPLNRHTANDKKGYIGDIQVNEVGSGPFEGVEVKDGHAITPAMIRVLPQKLQGFQVDRYYLLSTLPDCIAPGEENAVEEALERVRQETGCEVIANGLIRTLWYYLRLLSKPDAVLENYTLLMTTDQDVRDQQRELWGEILRASQ